MSNVRELHFRDDEVDALDEMLGEADAIKDPDADALLDAEREAEVTRMAIKRKIAEAADVDAIPRDLPAKLRINTDDPEDVVSAVGYLLEGHESKFNLDVFTVVHRKA